MAHAFDTTADTLHPTRELAAWIAATPGAAIDARTRRWARHCLLDWLAVTAAGAGDPLVEILAAEALADGGTGAIALAGRSERLSPSWAILVNGAAGHALDFDDVNRTMHGHPTVAVLPAVLTAVAVEGKSLEDVLASFTVGYEAACLVGGMTGDGHYDTGFHATATVGTFGAAAGVCHLLGLDAERTAHAPGLAATMAAGIKSMFGTMAKPLHAGRAAQSGHLAARLAARGFTTRDDALECAQGFWETQAPDAVPAPVTRGPADPYLIEQNLFKYHAACYMTHSSIEACGRLRAEHGITPERVRAVTLRVHRGHLRMCNIPEPESGLEIKFSLRHTAALALAGRDTAAISTYCEAVAHDPALVALRRKITVEPVDLPREQATLAVVTLETVDGETLVCTHDTAVPATDLDDQEAKLSAKFDALTEPVLGAEKAAVLKAMALDGDAAPGEVLEAAAL